MLCSLNAQMVRSDVRYKIEGRNIRHLREKDTRKRNYRELPSYRSFNSLKSTGATRNLDSLYKYLWDADFNAWYPDEIDAFYYDPQNRTTTEYYSPIWNGEIDWEYTDKLIFSYDTEGKTVSATLYITEDGNIWYEDVKEVYTYHSSGSLTEAFGYYFNDSSLSWYPAYKDTIILDTQNQFDSVLLYQWDDNLENWSLQQLEIYDYNTNDLLETVTSYSYIASEFLPYWKEIYTYDVYGNVFDMTHYSWDEIDEWYVYFKDNYYYQLTSDQLILPELFKVNNQYFFQDMPVYSISKDFADPGWLNYDSIVFYFNDPASLGFDKIHENEISVFPIPANDKISIELKGNDEIYTATILDLQGIQVLSENFSGQIAIPLTDVVNGVYLLIISQDTELKYREKILVNKY